MPWWGWLVMAAALLAFELFVIDAQFYLVFLGVSAALVGLLGLADGTMPAWEQWLAFAGLSIVTMLAFRDRVYQLVRKRTGHVDQRLTLGDRVVIPVRLEPGQTLPHRVSRLVVDRAQRRPAGHRRGQGSRDRARRRPHPACPCRRLGE